MAVSVTASAFSIAQDGSVTVTYSDGGGHVYGSLNDMKMAIADIETRDVAERLFLGWFLARSANATNTAIFLGKTFTFDLTNNNPIRVQ
jgi:hypothetical protein